MAFLSGGSNRLVRGVLKIHVFVLEGGELQIGGKNCPRRVKLDNTVRRGHKKKNMSDGGKKILFCVRGVG